MCDDVGKRYEEFRLKRYSEMSQADCTNEGSDSGSATAISRLGIEVIGTGNPIT